MWSVLVGSISCSRAFLFLFVIFPALFFSPCLFIKSHNSNCILLNRSLFSQESNLYSISSSLLHFWKLSLTSFPTNIWLISIQKNHYTWKSQYTMQWCWFDCSLGITLLYLIKPLDFCQNEGWWFVLTDFID